MANKRVITSGIFEDEFFGALGMMQRLLWIGLFSRCADDQGRLMDNAVVIRSQVFPYDDIPIQEIDGALDAFAVDGKVLRYKDERGRGYIQLVKWWENQTPQWAMRSKYPAPEGWTDRVRMYANKQYVTENWPDKTTRHAQVDAPPEPEAPPDDYNQPVNPPGYASLSPQPVGHDHDHDHDNDNNQNIDSRSEGFDRPAEPPASQVYQNQEAVRIYREYFKANPNQLQAKKIVGFATDMDLWRSTCDHWAFHGWKANNLPGMQDLYRKGGAAGCGQCSARDGPRGSPKNGAATRAEIDKLYPPYRPSGS